MNDTRLAEPTHLDGAKLVDDLARIIRRYLIINPDEVTTIATWILFAHTHDAHRHSPILAFESPMPGCGKTTAAGLIAALVPKPVAASNVSKAVIYRLIEQSHPTLILDEAETFAFFDPEIRGILDSGHSRATCYVLRAHGDKFEPKTFSAWTPKVLLYLGKAPATIQDRSIRIHMRRKLPGERVFPLPMDPIAEFAELRQRAERWAAENFAGVRDAGPVLPRTLQNRVGDNWRPLFAVSQVAGDRWPNAIAGAAQALAGTEEADVPEQLLQDIRCGFAEFARSEIPTAELLRILNANEERSWSSMNGGRGMKPEQLAKRLRPFGVRPTTLWSKDRTLKGYRLRDFADAFARYLDRPEGPEGPEGNVPDAA